MNEEILTERLRLRKLKDSDFEDYYKILKQEEVSRWLGSGKRLSKEDVKRMMESFQNGWLENGYGVWAVIERETNVLIGHCGFNILQDTKETELLYAIDPKLWGKGYATEAARASLEFMNENYKKDMVVALAYPNNERSSNLLKKVGFEYKMTEERFGVELLHYELHLSHL